LFRTRVTEILGIDCPIVEGGMAMAGNGELAAAVSNGGGLGVVSSNPGWAPLERRTENVRDHIRRARALTDRPLGANFPLFILGEHVERHLEMVVEEGIRIVVASGGSPKAMTRRFKDAGLTVLHVVGNVRQARAAEDAGVDMVVCEGYEAGGVENPDELTTMVLTPCVVDAVRIPVLAAGGIADARGLVAAFALGAEGVQMGSAFLATRECHVHPNFKKAIVESGDTATLMTQRALGRLSRALKTDLTIKLQELDRRGAADEIKALLAARPPGAQGRSDDAQYRGQMEGDLVTGEPAAGQAVALVREIKSASDVVRDVMSGAKAILERWGVNGSAL
jgi:enoyl-[acyl-carrier protein] reductase II